MKNTRNRLMSLLALSLLSCVSAAQNTTTLTGTVRDLGNNPVTSGKFVFTLKPSVDSTISGASRFVPGPPVTCGINSSGQIVNFVGGLPGTGSCVVIQNTALTPGGTYYQVDECPYYTCQVRFAFYATVASLDISNIIPTPGTSPVYGALQNGGFSYAVVAYSATPTFSPAGSLMLWKMTLTGNVTAPTLIAGSIPSIFIFELSQDATGGRTFTWPSNVIGGATIGSAANQLTVQEFLWDGSNAIALGPATLNP
jgi:hypothetical protein